MMLLKVVMMMAMKVVMEVMIHHFHHHFHHHQLTLDFCELFLGGETERSVRSQLGQSQTL